MWLNHLYLTNNELTAAGVRFKSMIGKVDVHLYGSNGEHHFSKVVIYCGFSIEYKL